MDLVRTKDAPIIRIIKVGPPNRRTTYGPGVLMSPLGIHTDAMAETSRATAE